MHSAPRMIHRTILCFMIVFMSCQTTVLNFAPSQGAEPTQSTAYGSMLVGIFEVSDPPEIPCPGQVRKIVITRNAWDFLLHFFLGGIYTTRRIRIYCE